MQTRDSVTLTILGGGSNFVPGFISTMCRRPEVFSDAQVRLHDIDMNRVELIVRFCRQYTSTKNTPMTFVVEPDLDKALEGADYVVTNYRIGGTKALEMDETIPTRYGSFGEETTGAGGLFMAMRTIPVVLDAAKRMERLCPDAWLLNYANPTNFNTDAVLRTSSTKCVGLCDGYICPPDDIGISLGLDPKTITTRHAGLNHCAWTYQAECNGRDLLKELREADPQMIEANLAKVPGEFNWTTKNRKRWYELFKLTGLYPAPGVHMECYFYLDENVREQLEHLRRDRGLEAEVQRDGLRAVLADFTESRADEVAAVRGEFGDLAIGVVGALAGDTGELFPANVPQGTAFSGMHPETIVESYCKVTGNGFTPVEVPAFPEFIQAQQVHLAAYQRLAVRGILEKDRNVLLQALCLHPFFTSVNKAREVFDAMWEAERETLGTYWL